ncbi:hypothetical protein N7516_001087 [Penicillium verrucosum]|uniref:uncharacterized protein n=1 Tax=Penicillium verrucosum TaxID=60171 RepID=UPI0025453F47|nr:uncharacterized protein N7516_001087 [Penicillium verrucosum]KAJ5940919.1 hypothetical protein N7516_001087 [Penicillium verrucosum]
MISSLKEAERGFSSGFFRSPADSLSAGAWGKLLLCTERGACCDMGQLTVESPSDLGKAARDWFEIEGRAPKRVEGRR